MIGKNNFFKINILNIFFCFFLAKYTYAENINNFNIQGNERVSDETVIMFSELDIGDFISQDKLNQALKKLYYTDYFKEVEISFENKVVIINVKENPIIQDITIDGVDKNSLYDKIKEITSKIEKYPFVENKVNDQVVLLKNLLKSYGYYFVELDVFTKENENNTVDLTYDFNLGEIAKIYKIKFIGNKVFGDNKLRNIIISEETKFWKFITRNKFLDTNRIKADVFKLENYYRNRGYYNVKINSTFAIINDQNQFELVFNIDSGKKFFFSNVNIKEAGNIQIEDFAIFQEKFKDFEGEKYSKKKLENLINELNDYTLKNDFIFINATYTEILKDNNLIDVVITLDDVKKNYVERINILGNFITDEKVIRNLLIIDEGDPFNKILFEKSIQDIKSQNIFKEVKYKSKSNNNLSQIIDITVEEKATGEIFAGAGTGTTGSSITAGIKENNYLGLGIKLDTNLAITDDSIKGKFLY